MNITWLLLGMILLGGCARAPLTTREQAMRPGRPPVLADDLPFESLATALETQASLFERTPAQELTFGPRRISAGEYARGMRRLSELARQGTQAFFAQVPQEFDFYEPYGQSEWGDGFFTGYYELNVEGARKKSSRFSQPIYGRPKDLLALDLAVFDEKYGLDRKLRGRLDPDGAKVLPYYTRAEIDGPEAPLMKSKRAEVLCWMEPVDAFFLQVQGSGVVRLPGGKSLVLNYAEKNGAKYESVAKFLKGKVQTQDFNLHVLESYLRALKADELQAFLNQNPSYVFFKKGETSAVTSSGASATDGRTAAIDARFFPLGAVAFILTEKPVGDGGQWTPFSRFVVGQDTGGAITGGGRMDLFFGRDAAAKEAAGLMKRKGRIWYVLPKSASTP